MQRLAEILFQYKEYATAFALIIVSLVLISHSSSEQLRSFRTISVGMIASVQSAFSWIPNPYALKSENTVLRRLDKDYALELMQLRKDAARGEHYREMLGFKRVSPMKLLPAEVLMKTTIQLRNYATLNVGSGDGVAVGMPVMTERGLVGRVIGTSENYSVVQLLINRDMRVAARTLRERIDGLVTFDGRADLLMKNVASVEPVKLGDTVTTSSYSPFFPAGIPIGTVGEIQEEDGSLFYRIKINPAVNFATLEEAFVVLHSPDEERIELERSVIEPREARGGEE